MPIADSKSLTVILDRDNRVFYYYGDWDNSLRKKEIGITGYPMNNGIGNIIRQKQKTLEEQNPHREKSNELMLVIKAGERSDYKNLVDILDEVLINNVKHYALVELTEAEKNYMEMQ